MDASSLKEGLGCATSRQEVVSVLKECQSFCLAESGRNTLHSANASLVLGTLVSRISQPFMGCLTLRERTDLVEKTFLCAPLADSFLSLEEGITRTPISGYALEKLLGFLQVFVKTGGCGAAVPVVCQRIVSLPDKMEKVLGRFNETKYFLRVSTAFTGALEKVREMMRNGRDCDLQFLSQLMCKLQMSGHGKGVMRVLIPWLGRRCGGTGSPDFTWRRISQRLLTRDLPRMAAEGILTEVLLLAKAEDLDGLLGDSICDNQTLEFLMTNKLFLVRTFPVESGIGKKVGVYLSGGERRRVFLSSTLLLLLEAWADSGAITHNPVEQRRHISRSIITLTGMLREEEKERVRERVMSLWMEGMQPHLESPDRQLRTQGMVVGEELARAFHPSANALDFQVDKDEEEVAILLRDISHPKLDSSTLEEEDILSSLALEEEVASSSKEVDVQAPSYDSDDDFQPYDIPQDETQSVGEGEEGSGKKWKSPVYIRDCMEGLEEDKDFGKFQSSFLACEKLVRREAVGFREIALELTQRLLNLEDRFSTPDFEAVRRGCLVASCVKKPKEVVHLLAAESFKRNYTILQRLLMLDVICESAKELANISTSGGDSVNEGIESLAPPSQLLPSWTLEIDKRVAAKTRRFSSRKSTPENIPKVNRFAALAPDFFFPLINGYDGKNGPHLDLLGRDYLVLGRLLYTVGTVTFCAQNSPCVCRLCEGLLGYVWGLRYHAQSFVRQGVLYCLSMLLMALPPQTLSTHLSGSMEELKNWLLMVEEKDPDAECGRMARNAFGLFNAQLKRNLEVEASGRPGIPRIEVLS